jgi:hypothetical protein
MINKIIDGFNWLIEKLNNLKIEFPEWAPFGLADKYIGFNIGKWRNIDIPRLAQGTVVPPNMSEFLALLGDNKKETEVVSPLSTIKQALQEVMAEQNINVTFQVEGDPNGLFKVIQKESLRYNQRTGVSSFA